jgi:5-methylcytosine-specific restriction endonuclease McrA
VHHLQHQKDANDDGIIYNSDGILFHKNNLANLITLCEPCHNEFHKKNVKHKKVKTTKGYKLQSI